MDVGIPVPAKPGGPERATRNATNAALAAYDRQRGRPPPQGRSRHASSWALVITSYGELAECRRKAAALRQHGADEDGYEETSEML